MVQYFPVITGSLTVSGSIIATGAISMSGSIASSSYATNTSYLNNSGSGEFVPTGSFNAFSSSILTYTGSVNSQLSALQVTTGSNITRIAALEVASGSAITRLSSIEAKTGSYATTGSNIFVGNQTITGSVLQSGSLSVNGCIVSSGQIVAQTINVQQVTSSVVYSCGSNIFGNTISNTQTLTGSVLITGSLNTVGASCVNGPLNVLNGNQFRVYNTGNGDYGNLTFATTTGFTSDKQIQANSKLFIQRASAGADTLLQFKNESGVDRAYIKFGGTNEELSFYAGSGTTQNFIINAAGCVGINTSCPKDLLEVYGDTNNGINICASNQPRLGFFVGGTSVDNKIWDFIPQSNNTFIARVVNDAKNSAATWISVTRNGASITSICFPQTNPMVISGCVGIGIVPNSAGLRLAACTVLRVEGACVGEVSPDNFGISLGGLGSLRIDAPGVGGGRFVVNSDGNVSIGNPTPANKLTVCGNDSGFQGCPSMRFYIARGCCQTVGSIIFTTGNTSVTCGWAEIGQTDNNGDLYFKANSTIGNFVTRMVIKGDTGVTMFCCQFCAPAAHIVNCLGVGTAPGSAAFTTGNAGITNQNTYLGTGQLRVGGGADHSSNQVLSIAPGVVGVDAPGVSNGRFVINSSGNVGIGTASPSDKLQVLGSLRWGGSSVNLVSSNDASGMYIENSGTTTTNRTIRIQGINDTGTRYSQFFVKAGSAEFCFVTEDAHRFSITCDGRSYFTCQLNVGSAGVASNFIIDGSIANGSCVVSGIPGTARGGCMSGLRLYATNSGTSNAMTGIWFSTGPHWAGIASGRCDVNAGWGTDLRFYVHYQATDTLDNTYEKMRLNPEGVLTLFGYGAGTLSTNSAGVISASDGRLKTKTRFIDSGLCTIMQLQPTYYRWNEGTAFHTEYEELGFIAQEVSCIIPEASPEPEEEHKLKNYSDRAIIAMLTKGMQEQQCIINTLKTCLGIV